MNKIQVGGFIRISKREEVKTIPTWAQYEGAV